MPGWITLWRGMKVLRLLVRGAKLERARMNAHVHCNSNGVDAFFRE
jgi:polynucleotide 5'-kinase involved in rRNA processing